jgi:hypothetical protein
MIKRRFNSGQIVVKEWSGSGHLRADGALRPLGAGGPAGPLRADVAGEARDALDALQGGGVVVKQSGRTGTSQVDHWSNQCGPTLPERPVTPFTGLFQPA